MIILFEIWKAIRKPLIVVWCVIYWSNKRLFVLTPWKYGVRKFMLTFHKENYVIYKLKFMYRISSKLPDNWWRPSLVQETTFSTLNEKDYFGRKATFTVLSLIYVEGSFSRLFFRLWTLKENNLEPDCLRTYSQALLLRVCLS